MGLSTFSTAVFVLESYYMSQLLNANMRKAAENLKESTHRFRVVARSSMWMSLTLFLIALAVFFCHMLPEKTAPPVVTALICVILVWGALAVVGAWLCFMSKTKESESYEDTDDEG